jgi:carboxymethylenebutenolidase
MFGSIMAQQELTPAQQELVNVLEDHRRAELEELNVDHTLATMVERPYIFFVGTLTGGDDRRRVRDFYANLMNQLPKDMVWIPISSTVGTDKIVIESVLTFTHNISVDWILPKVLPTGAKVKIPLVIIFTFRDGKLASERIYWDQASTLVQLGLLKSDGLPVSGVESADKLLELTKPGERFGD